MDWKANPKQIPSLTWKARVTDPKLVPAYFDGYELREINMTALNALARQYEGGLDIPGVEFYQENQMSVRIK